MKKVSLTIVLMVLFGCETTNNNNENSNDVIRYTASHDQKQCLIYQSRNWLASLKPSSANSAYLLSVTGEVDLPSPAYKVSWSREIMDRANPPSLRIQLSTHQAEEGAAIQMISPTKVNHNIPTDIAIISSVIVGCGKEVLATIPVSSQIK
jgi:hypothetical protein